MSLLSMAKSVAFSVGITEPLSMFADRTGKMLAQFAQETGEEMARRVDWGELTQTITLTGDGTSKTFPIDGISRIAKGASVRHAGGIVRPLTRAEWGTLDPVEGAPRYYLLEGNDIEFWPYLADTDTLTVVFQTKNFVANGTDTFTLSTDEVLLDEKIFAKGMEVRWRRAQGMAYQDQEAEFESALSDIATFDDRARM